MTIDPQTPVLVGAAAATQRVEEPGGGLDAAGLMAEVLAAAGRDAGAPGLLARTGWAAAMEGTTAYPDPARLATEAVGADGAATYVVPVGVTQQEVIARACAEVAAGAVDVAVVLGGEARFRDSTAARAGVTATVTEQPGVDAAPRLAPPELGVTDLEITRGFVTPVQVYAAVDNALAASRGWTVAEHRAYLGRLWAGEARVAAANPEAWDRSAPDATAIAEPGPGNRMIAWPYTRRLASQWNVDQAAALVVCSAAVAEAVGVPRDRWVFPWSSAVCNHAVPVAQRAEPHRSPGAAAAGAAALAAAGVGTGDLGPVDLYSCFPAAVQVYAAELGMDLDPDHPPTTTGGMTFAGGPLNNYVLQAMVPLVRRLREDPSRPGLSTSVSGFLTKQGFGVWSASPPASAFRSLDVTGEVAGAHPARPVRADGSGPATVVAHTVDVVDGEPFRAVAVLELADGARTIGQSHDGDLLARVVADGWVGARVEVAPDGTISA